MQSLVQAEAAFQQARPRLFGIAYRMLGSVSEAEDLVQDVWLRWQAADRSAVRDATAFLATTTTRLAINELQSARARRETYVGPWLPEPIDTAADPQLGAERSEALSLAVLLLLENLTPAERAAYVLREAFDYAYEPIADVLQTSEANARQLVTRARRHLAEGRRANVSADSQRELLSAFIAAAQQGDLAGLERLFAADVVSFADGGGFAQAARRPVEGRPTLARFMVAVAAHFWQGASFTPLETNGQPSVLIERDGHLIALVTLEASEQGIERVLWMMNPHKLHALKKS